MKFITLIQEKYPSFTKSEQKVANHILQIKEKQFIQPLRI